MPQLAELVVAARQALKEWDGKSAASDVVESIRHCLAPLSSAADEISDDARRKLREIDEALERFADAAISPDDRESLDMLMLGLWIRVDDDFEPRDLD